MGHIVFVSLNIKLDNYVCSYAKMILLILINIRPIGVGATFTTGIACILIIVQSLLDRDLSKPAYHSKTDPMNFSRSFGTMVFAVSGHSVMPTIINDMKNKSDFKKAALLGYGSNRLFISHIVFALLL